MKNGDWPKLADEDAETGWGQVYDCERRLAAALERVRTTLPARARMAIFEEIDECREYLQWARERAISA